MVKRGRCPYCGVEFKVGKASAEVELRCKGCGWPIPPSVLRGGEPDETRKKPPFADADLWPSLPSSKKQRTRRPPADPKAQTSETAGNACPHPTRKTGDTQSKAVGHDQRPHPDATAPADDTRPDAASSAAGPTFRQDLWRLALPFRTWTEASTFICVSIVITGMPFLRLFGFCCCAGWVILAGLAAMLASFFAAIIQETAEGIDELPNIGSLRATLESPWSEIVVPISSFVGAAVCVLLPAMIAVLLFELAARAGYHVPGRDIVVGVMAFVGIFFWPIVVLIIAFDQLNLLLRPRLILKWIIAVIRPYLLAWLCLLVALGILYAARTALGSIFEAEGFSGPGFLLALVVNALELAVFIYAMRVVGLLYRHYQNHLTWDE